MIPRSVAEHVRHPVDSARKVADAALWGLARRRAVPFERSRLLLSRRRSPGALDVSTGDADLDRAFSENAEDVLQHEFVLEADAGIIEPRYGFHCFSPTHVLFESLNPRLEIWGSARASLTDLARATRGNAHMLVNDVDAVVSLRDFNDNNVWHSVNDLFAKLLLAEEAGVPRDVPALVGPGFAAAHFFPLVEPAFRSLRPLIVQEPRTYVRAARVYCAATLNYDMRSVDGFLDAFHGAEGAVRGTVAGAQRAIFITRSASRPRTPGNIDDIHRVAERLGLEVVDFDSLAPGDVVATMRSASTVVGFHGAGLANLMFRRGAPTRVGEIGFTHWVNPAYVILARHLGFAYRGLLVAASSTDQYDHAAFRVDLGELEQFLADVLEQPETCAYA